MVRLALLDVPLPWRQECVGDGHSHQQEQNGGCAATNEAVPCETDKTATAATAAPAATALVFPQTMVPFSYPSSRHPSEPKTLRF